MPSVLTFIRPTDPRLLPLAWRYGTRAYSRGHSPRLAACPEQSFLKDWIYGGIDGTVATFALVAGVIGAHLSPRIILILGGANLIADGFAMAASNYLAA